MFIQFIKYRKFFYWISGILVVASIASILVFRLTPGIDFTGGSVVRLKLKQDSPSLQNIRQEMGKLDLGSFVLQKTGDNDIVLKTKITDQKTLQKIVNELKRVSNAEQNSENIESIGPVIGQELKHKTKVVMVLSLLVILFYIAFSFRKVHRPVKSWIYGATSLIALFHDVLITLGVFVVLGKFYGVELTIPIITAFLTVFGYSINDSVVVFDRVRENLSKNSGEVFELTIDKSLNQTLKRSVNTSFTTLIALLAIFFFGGQSLKFFSLALIIGIGLGTYSSIFLATPLLLTYLRFKERKYRDKR